MDVSLQLTALVHHTNIAVDVDVPIQSILSLIHFTYVHKNVFFYFKMFKFAERN